VDEGSGPGASGKLGMKFSFAAQAVTLVVRFVD
jgi:hypothetical protein